MDYQEVIKNARGDIGPYCKACPVCNGAACGSTMPGPGAKGTGKLAMRNYEKWQEIRINMDTIREKMELVKKSGAFAVAMDIDAAGLPFLQNLNPPAGSKSVEELREIVKMAEIPFILKGIMTPRGAEKAMEAGVQGIVVSNHGGRVLDQCPAPAEVLPSIVKVAKGQIKVFADGGIRTGTDVFKALALGADAVLIARPFVTAVYGGQEEGVAAYVDKIGAELRDTMMMCGASSVDEITDEMIWKEQTV